MAAKSPVGIDCDEQRAELKQVLQSRSFVRAPTLAHLLSYLGEKLFAGEASQIKEYSIGVEVFHRGASFDQDSDSIVRVEANRLRKRLAEYYAGEGASHRIHIVIPVGQYVPEFILAAPGQDETRAGSEASSTTGQGAPDRAGARWLGLPGHWRWWLAGAISRGVSRKAAGGSPALYGLGLCRSDKPLGRGKRTHPRKYVGGQGG